MPVSGMRMAAAPRRHPPTPHRSRRTLEVYGCKSPLGTSERRGQGLAEHARSALACLSGRFWPGTCLAGVGKARKARLYIRVLALESCRALRQLYAGDPAPSEPLPQTMSSFSSVLKLLGLGLWLASVLVNGQHGRRRPRDWAARNRATIERIYDLTVYPNQLPIIQGGAAAVPERLFADGTRGRITPVGEFEDLEGTVEYFWGLAPVPQGPNGTIFSRSEVVSFQSQCPEVASSVVYLYTSRYDAETGEPGEEISILKQVRMRPSGPVGQAWDGASAVTRSTDCVLEVRRPRRRSLLRRIDPDAPAVVHHHDRSGPVAAWVRRRYRRAGVRPDAIALHGQQHAVRQPRGLHTDALAEAHWRLQRGLERHCRVPDHSSLAGSDPTRGTRFAPVDSLDDGIADPGPVVLCQIHCPHVGPTGGGKCVDKPYLDKYFDDERLFGRPTGTTFVCDPEKKRGHR